MLAFENKHEKCKEIHNNELTFASQSDNRHCGRVCHYSLLFLLLKIKQKRMLVNITF